jgi:hypothetical protein
MAVALPNVTVKWVTPAPLWGQASTSNGAMITPFVAEFASDRFMPDFLDMMGGKTPLNLKGPADTASMQMADGKTRQAFKLYLPFHQRHYLVTASLVCRQLGMPDHTVDRKNGEKVSFVLRRLGIVNGSAVEQGWVNDGPQKGWQQVSATTLLPNEERKVMHPVKVQPQPLASATPSARDVRANTIKPEDQRVVYHGYIPAANREKYLAPMPNPAQLIQDAITKPTGTTPPPTDPRLDEVTSRVIVVWYNLFDTTVPQPPLYDPANPEPVRPTLQEVSLFILVDLGDFLKNNLKEVFDNVLSGGNFAGNAPARQALLVKLRGITLSRHDNTNNIDKQIALDQALQDLQNNLDLARGIGDEPTNFSYNVSPATTSATQSDLTPPQTGATSGGTLYNLLRDALAEDANEKQNQTWLKLPPEINGLIKDEPAAGDVYFVRLVYEHAPCDPVLSDVSPLLTFARFFDPDAPARPIRIELPSIRPKDLRKYKRGVGLQFSPELNNLINRVNTGMLKGDGLTPMAPGSGANLGIAFICSFSISITFLVAIIVMFIFLILFNIIFWWLPFIRICFPIPTRK